MSLPTPVGPVHTGPHGAADQEGATITLTVEPSGGSCTAQAMRDTFLVQGFSGHPKRLLVQQQGQKDVALSLER